MSGQRPRAKQVHNLVVREARGLTQLQTRTPHFSLYESIYRKVFALTSSSVWRHLTVCVSRQHVVTQLRATEWKTTTRNPRNREEIAWLSKGNAVNKRQKRGYSDHKHEASTKYHKYPANETDEEREHRLPTLQENAAKRIRNESQTPFLFRLTIPDILWASPELREILRSKYF